MSRFSPYRALARAPRRWRPPPRPRFEPLPSRQACPGCLGEPESSLGPVCDLCGLRGWVPTSPLDHVINAAAHLLAVAAYPFAVAWSWWSERKARRGKGQGASGAGRERGSDRR